MIHERLQSGPVPAACRSFVAEFEERCHERLGELRRRRDISWNGERLFATYQWFDASEQIVLLRFQYFPRHGQIWIGWIQVHPMHRGEGIATSVVEALGRSASASGREFVIRLFSRLEIAGFWNRIGFEPEEDVRFLRRVVGVSG